MDGAAYSTASALAIALAYALKRYNMVAGERRRLVAACLIGVFATLVFALISEALVMSQRGVGELLLQLATVTLAAVGVMHEQSGSAFPAPPTIGPPKERQ